MSKDFNRYLKSQKSQDQYYFALAWLPEEDAEEKFLYYENPDFFYEDLECNNVMLRPLSLSAIDLFHPADSKMVSVRISPDDKENYLSYF